MAGETFQHRPDELSPKTENAEIPENREGTIAQQKERQDRERSIRSLREIFEQAEAEARAKAALNGPDGLQLPSTEELLNTIRMGRERRLQEKTKAQRSIAFMLLSESFVTEQARRDRETPDAQPRMGADEFREYLAENWGTDIPEDPSGIEAVFRAFVESESDLKSRLAADLGPALAENLCTAMREQMRLYLSIVDLELSRSAFKDKASLEQLEYALAQRDLEDAERELLVAFRIRAESDKDGRTRRLLASKEGASEVIEIAKRAFAGSKEQQSDVQKSAAAERIEQAAPNLTDKAKETMATLIESGSGDVAYTVLSSGAVESSGDGSVTAMIEGEKITIAPGGILRTRAYLTLPDGKRIPLPLDEDFATEFDRARGNAIERRSQISFLGNAPNGLRDRLMKALGNINTKDAAFMNQREAETWKLRLRSILRTKGDASEERTALRSLGILRDDGTTHELRAAWFRTYFRVLEGRSGATGLQSVHLRDLQALAARWDRDGKISLPTVEELRRGEIA